MGRHTIVVLLALGLLGCGPERPEHPNILLITIDTLRADHLSSYGYPRLTSPTIDRLASEGVRFERAWVQWPKTGPSFASIFTSIYPHNTHIVRKIGIPLPNSYRLLAEVLRQQGYGTHAVVSNGAVAREFGFAQGFDDYVESWQRVEGTPDEQTRAETVNRLVLELLPEIDRERPWLLWVHYLDPHFPYTPPGEWADRFQDDEHFEPVREIRVDERRLRKTLGGLGHEQVLEGRTDLGFYVARYDAEIAYNDEQLGRLLAELDQRGMLANTLTVLSSDHGESLGEHEYYFDHGAFGFEDCLRVPLIVHYPGVLEPRVVETPTMLIDLAPTLLEQAGVELPAGRWMQGRSLWPRLSGAEPEPSQPTLVYAEAGYATRGRWQKVVSDGQKKLIYVPHAAEQPWVGGRGKHFALFDLQTDPGETINLAQELPDVTERFAAALTAWWRPDSFEAAIDAEEPETPEGMSDETREQLEALGYLQ